MQLVRRAVIDGRQRIDFDHRRPVRLVRPITLMVALMVQSSPVAIRTR
jgi:hypothetical protein